MIVIGRHSHYFLFLLASSRACTVILLDGYMRWYIYHGRNHDLKELMRAFPVYHSVVQVRGTLEQVITHKGQNKSKYKITQPNILLQVFCKYGICSS